MFSLQCHSVQGGHLGFANYGYHGYAFLICCNLTVLFEVEKNLWFCYVGMELLVGNVDWIRKLKFIMSEFFFGLIELPCL